MRNLFFDYSLVKKLLFIGLVEPYVRPPENNRLRTYDRRQTFQVHFRT